MKECCRKYLSEQFGDDQDVIAEIYAEYENTIVEKLAEIEAAFASQDWLVLDRAAHAIKGCAFAAGDNEMAEVAIELRQAARLQGNEKAKGEINKLKALKEML